MDRYDEINKEISMEVQVSEGRNERRSIHDFYISKMALAVKRAILGRTELQASIINMESAVDCLIDINTVEADYLRSRCLDIEYDTHELLGMIETDMKLALIDIGRHYKAEETRYDALLRDLVHLEEYKEASDVVNAMACAICKFDYKEEELED